MYTQLKLDKAPFFLVVETDIVGLVSRLMQYRNTVLNDIEDMRKSRPSRTNLADDILKMALNVDLETKDFHDAEIIKRFKIAVNDYSASKEEDDCAQKILVTAHLRRLRNLYIVLMEICRKDEKCLAW